MKTKLLLILTLFLCKIALHAQISISSFSPSSGNVGAFVTISGTNFSTILANNIVTFNGVAATVTASTSTSITATVPTGASSGSISVTIAGNTASSANWFGVDVKACGVSFLDPGGNSNYANNQNYSQTFSPVNPTDKLTVTFSSFDLEQEYDYLKVYNGPSTASPLLAQLTGTTLPSNITSSAPGGELTFLFTSDEIVTRSGWAATISCGVPPTTISAFTPTSGQVGASITITGTNFSTITANNLVTFNGVAATVTASTTTSITATVPAGATSGPISVTIAGNTSTSANFFGVQVKACGVPFLDPGGNGDYTNNQTYAQTFSPVNPTEKVTVSFSSLDLEQENDFLYVYNGPSIASPLLMELTGTTLPSNITSSALGGELTFFFTSDQSVTRSGWTANISCGVPPTVTSFTPVSGQVGTSVTITGTNFSTISSNNVVKFNGELATVIASTSTSITAAVPAGATSGTISVAVAGHAVISATNFTVVFPQPTITSFSPAMGAVGTSVTIAGTNFDSLTGNTIVTVNGQIGAITSITSTSITVTVPSNATTGKIGVTVAGQAATSSTDFTVLTFPGEWLEKNNGIYTSNWVNALVVNGNNIYAGTSSGVFRSTNNGTIWTAVNLGLSSTDIRSLAVSGINLFAGTSGGGVFLSTNNGANWTAVNSGLPNNPLILSLVVSEGNLYAGTYNDGVFRSTNSGTSWTSINTGLTNTNVASLAVSGSNLYAGTYNRGVFRSTDNGNSWTAVNAGLPSNPTVYSLAAGGGNLYAGTFNSGVFRSTDNGASWTAVNSGLTSTSIRSLTVSGSDLYAGTGANGVFRSTNNGISWTEVNTGLPSNSYISSLSVSGGNLYAGTDGGVFRSTNNGISWTASNSGLNRNTVRSFAASGDKLYAGTYNSGGVFRSTDKGTSWTAVNMGLTDTNVLSLAVSGGNLFAGTDGSGVFLSTNSGTNWTAANTGLPSVIRALTVSGNNLFAGTNYNGVYRSTDNGASWTEVNSGLPANTASRAFAVVGNNLFMGTFKGGIYLSTNNGDSWTAVNSGLTNLNVYSFAVIGNSIFAGTNGGGVFVSTNNGASWTSVGSGLLNTWVYALAASGNNLFAGTTENGVFLSTNNGNSWTAVNNGLPTNRIASLLVSGSELFAGSWNGGVWSRPISELVSKQPQSITFAALPAKTFGDANFTLSATASSGLSVSYTSNNTAVATISGSTVTVVGVGTSTITASQVGNDFFAAAANVTQTLTVNKASQTITFAALPAKTFGNANFTLSATASSGLPVTYTSSNTAVATISGNTVTIIGVGTSTITAIQAGNDSFNSAANVTQTLTVNKASQAISFTPLADKILGDAAFTLTGVASSNLAVVFSTTSDKITISGTQATLVKAGRASIVASQAGNDSFNSATSVTQNFCIKPAKPTITTANNTGTVILTSNAATGNQWYLSGNAISGGTSPSFSATASGVYKVQATVDDCVSEFSAEQPVVITGDIKQEAYISISPNPVEDLLQLNGIIGEVKSTQLFDMTGRASLPLVLEKTNNHYQTSVGHLSAGVYLLRILLAESVVQLKFIKK